jgi:hypothetical protein
MHAWSGFEHTIPMFERPQTVHALDRAAIVIGVLCFRVFKIEQFT